MVGGTFRRHVELALSSVCGLSEPLLRFVVIGCFFFFFFVIFVCSVLFLLLSSVSCLRRHLVPFCEHYFKKAWIYDSFSFVDLCVPVVANGRTVQPAFFAHSTDFPSCDFHCSSFTTACLR